MAISKEYYKDLPLEELTQDDFFIQSIQLPDEKTATFWREFLLQYPDKKNEIEEAGRFVENLKFFNSAAPTGAKERVWNHIISEAKKEGSVVSINSKRRWMWAAAAVAGIIVVTAAWLLLQSENTIKESTRYTEVKQVTLPDQSVVTLNANSSIEYKKEWKAGQPREVWMKGEAFFDVKHLNKEGQPVKASDRFIVHAGTTNVEVLGTSFNVSDRQAVTKVVLQTGKVRLDFKDKQTASVTMEPGEVVNYDQQSKRLVKGKTTTEKYTSWKKKEFLLDNTSVEEVVAVIENTFGYKVVIEGKEMLNRQLSGAGKVSLENEETLFKSLELMLDVFITKKDDTLYIKKK